jgi:hypothetical protein
VVELCGELFHTWFWESDLMLGINITLWKMMKSHMFPKWGESLTSNSKQVGEFSTLGMFKKYLSTGFNTTKDEKMQVCQ